MQIVLTFKIKFKKRQVIQPAKSNIYKNDEGIAIRDMQADKLKEECSFFEERQFGVVLNCSLE